jgi:3-deoxy-manno-octulosonate cytidylyltransferase (CMP-KDO synthetase)
MKVAAFIPARFGSTRLDGKPLADIGGKPMIQWVYERALASRLVDDVVVATDDERILDAVKAFGGAVVMTSSEHVSGTDRVAEAAAATSAGIIVNIQGDEPLIEPEMIDAAVGPMIEDPALSVCTLMTRITDESEYRDPNVVKVVVDAEGFALYFSRSPIPFSKAPFKEAVGALFKHVGLYVYSREFLKKFTAMKPAPLEEAEGLEQLRVLHNGIRIKVVETPFNPVSVDTPEDLEMVRRMVT